LTLGLLGVFVLSACASATATPPPPPPPVQLPIPTETAAAPTPTQAEMGEAAPAESMTPTEEPIVVIPTSRGNELEATDPTTVNIASGEPQLIEFFAFW